MAKNRFSTEVRESVFGKIVEKEISSTKGLLNFIDFIEGESGPRTKLYPVQRVIGKLIFGVPIDYKEIMVDVWDPLHEKILYHFKESEYISYLYNEGRINIEDWRDIPEQGFNEAIIFAGRRGGKSQLVAACADYKLYKLLSIRSPHEHYGLVEGSPIEFTFLAQDGTGANRLYDKFKSDVNSSPFFNPYLRKSPGTKNMEFVTEADKDKRDVLPSIKVGAYPCTTNAVRGPSSYFLALDEFAHFRNEKGSNSDEVYEAAVPATMNFTSVEDGRLESLILTITSPWKKEGKSYDLWTTAMQDGIDSGILAMRCPTAEMNPRSSSEFLKRKLKSAPLTWKAEYGGEFLDSSESYVSGLVIDNAVDQDRYNTTKYSDAIVNKLYFWGLDLGMKNDATALAISHLEFNENSGLCLIYDYVDRLMVGEPPYENVTELPLDDIINWLIKMNDILPCYKGITDQHGGSMLVQLLKMNGIDNMELVHLSSGINSQMYYTLKGLLDQGRVRFPNNPKFIREIKNVEATIVGKYQIRVQAPNEKGAHDDMSDAVAESAYTANRFMIEESRMLEDIINGLDNKGAILMGSEPFNIDDVGISSLKMMERQRAIFRNQTMGSQLSKRLSGRRF